MSTILLGVTGSVAACKTPELVCLLQAQGHEVMVVATKPALYFFDLAALPAGVLKTDADEWPGERYERGAEVLHIELRRQADLLLIAPLDANTLAKLALGLCDNLLTCVWRAWDQTKPVLLAPAMNTLMWENPFTRKHLRAIGADFGATHVPGHLETDLLIQQINDRSSNFCIIPPIIKQLACGDEGVGALAELESIVETTQKNLKHSLS